MNWFMLLTDGVQLVICRRAHSMTLSNVNPFLTQPRITPVMVIVPNFEPTISHHQVKTIVRYERQHESRLEQAVAKLDQLLY